MPPDRLAQARIVAVYVVLTLIAVSVVFDLVDERSHLDTAVFATLAGSLLALLGVGAVVKWITMVKP